jgi:streptolysin S family bacteriocin protoxin
MSFVSKSRIEERWDSTGVVVAPAGWCCCCCSWCWCHVNSTLTQEHADQEL